MQKPWENQSATVTTLNLTLCISNSHCLHVISISECYLHFDTKDAIGLVNAMHSFLLWSIFSKDLHLQTRSYTFSRWQTDRQTDRQTDKKKKVWDDTDICYHLKVGDLTVRLTAECAEDLAFVWPWSGPDLALTSIRSSSQLLSEWKRDLFGKCVSTLSVAVSLCVITLLMVTPDTPLPHPPHPRFSAQVCPWLAEGRACQSWPENPVCSWCGYCTMCI